MHVHHVTSTQVAQWSAGKAQSLQLRMDATDPTHHVYRAAPTQVAQGTPGEGAIGCSPNGPRQVRRFKCIASPNPGGVVERREVAVDAAQNGTGNCNTCRASLHHQPRWRGESREGAVDAAQNGTRQVLRFTCIASPPTQMAQ